VTALLTISCDRAGCDASDEFESETAYESGWRGVRYVTRWLCPVHAKDLWK
jgi:hypothetical protein